MNILRLKEVLKEKEMTGKDLAEKVEVTPASISNIVQGHKAYEKQNILGANAFYKKAQSDLLQSPHPDERRHKMISQVADVLHGRRKFLDAELMPETEFNPNTSDAETELETEGNDEMPMSEEEQAMMNAVAEGAENPSPKP